MSDPDRCLFTCSWRMKTAFRIKGLSILLTTSLMPPPERFRCAVFFRTPMRFSPQERSCGSGWLELHLHEAILVSDRAVGTDQGQKFVLVVGNDNVVAVKPVELGPEAEGLRVVRSGLTGDEQVIINGIVNARPGSKVSPQEGDMNQFKTNQLQLETSSRTVPVGDGKEKGGGNPPHPPAQGAPSNQPKAGGSR